MVRYARASAVLGALLSLVVSLPGTGLAGEPNPNWFNSPTSGPSPNTSHVVGNTDGGECEVTTRLEPQGLSVTGGILVATVQVTLVVPGDDPTENYQPVDGDWGGPFDIPEGLDPGTYPLTAECLFLEPPERTEAAALFGAPIILGGGQGGFDYADRSYTVVAPDPSDPADPVESEVDFTG